MSDQLVSWLVPEFDNLRNRFLDLFDGDHRTSLPAIDIERHKNDITIRADMPGVKPAQVKIKVEDGVLTISGKLDEQEEKKEKKYVRHERRYGSFVRSIVLPDGVDPSEIKAKTSNGVVEVTLPLAQESTKEPVTSAPAAA